MIRNDSVVRAFAAGRAARSGRLRTDGRSLWSYDLKIAERTLAGVVVGNFTSPGGEFHSDHQFPRRARQADRRHDHAPRAVHGDLREDALLMGVLVSLCDHRERLRQEEQSRTQEEIDQLKMLVDAWVAPHRGSGG